MSHEFLFSGERPDLEENDILRTDDDIAIGDVAVFERINPGLVAIRLLAISEVDAYRGKAYLVVPSKDGESPLLVQLHQTVSQPVEPAPPDHHIETAQHFAGRVFWIRPPGDVFAGIGQSVPWYFTDQAKAIRRSDSELIFEIKFQKASYVVYLTQHIDKSFSGYSIKTEDGKDLQVLAAGRLFQGANGCFFYGSWTEPNTTVKDVWWADLLPTNSTQTEE